MVASSTACGLLVGYVDASSGSGLGCFQGQ